MKLVSTLAIAAAIVGVAAGLPAPAEAQKAKRMQDEQAARQQREQPQTAQAAQAGPKRNYTKSAAKALQALQDATNKNDTAAFPAALAAAQAEAKTTDDRWFIAQMQLAMAQKSQDPVALRAAVEAVLKSGGAPAEDQPKLYKAVGGFAMNAKDYPGAIAAYQEALRLAPNDADVANNLVIAYREQKNYPQAIAIVEQRIAATKAAGQKPDEKLYLIALQTALDGKVNAKVLPLTRDFISAYPTICCR